MTSYRDWVVETSSTTGTGAYALSGSPPAGTSYFTFRQRYSNGETKVVYWVVNANRTKMEKNQFGTLTYGTPDTLSRNVVESTNGDAPVSWVSGDAPLKLYVVQDADAAEFAISMGLGAARPDVLKFGLWADEDGGGAGVHQIKLYDGDTDILLGAVNDTANTFRFDSGVIGQRVSTQTGAFASGTTQIPGDDTIPQQTEGDQYMSLAITPKSATSTLEIEVTWIGSTGVASGQLIVALFQDSTANAIAAATQHVVAGDSMMNFKFAHSMTSGTTSATTFKVRAGVNSAGTTRFNGNSGGRLMGGVIPSGVIIREVL